MARRTRSIRVCQRPPNLLILGASGNVARAFLRRLGGRRAHFGRLVLLDKSEHMRRDRFLEHRRLDYHFVRHRVRFPQDAGYYRQLLRRHRIGIVLDLSDMDTLPILSATDAAGVSYVNTSLNDKKLGVRDLADSLHPRRAARRRAPHILCSGMNPGVVNTWVCHGVRRYGVPQEIVHFEHDTSRSDPWQPLVTWSRKEFLTETAWERTGLVTDGKARILRNNGLRTRQSLRPYLAPLDYAPAAARGFLVLHEENLTLGRMLKVSSKFIYGLHPRTMAYLIRLGRRRRRIPLSALEVGDNTSIPLEGADTIGVCLEYPRQRVFYLNTLDNRSVVGTNATCTQVAVGVYAAVFALLYERLRPRVYFAGDLYDTIYPHVGFCNIRVEHWVFARRRHSLALRHHEPELRPRLRRGAEQVVI